jgi:hypothetical protein
MAMLRPRIIARYYSEYSVATSGATAAARRRARLG